MIFTLGAVIVLVVLACFGVVLLFGAPYLPTLTRQMNIALDMIDLRPGDTLLELGCGDGKVLVAAAQRGWRVVGYELNPLLVIICWLRTRRYRQLVTIKWGNFWTQPWPPCQGIFAFALQKYMSKLDKKIMQSESVSVKLISFAFTIPDKRPLDQREGMSLYLYEPAAPIA